METEAMENQRDMERLFDRLFPICRSITGPGVRDSLSILGEYLPLEVFSVPTGTQVFDWVVPKEWRIRGGWLRGPEGEVLADFERSNLHVVNYSVPVDGEFTLEELRPHLHSAPHLPGAIPYVTSYYKPRWGFCLEHDKLENLKQGTYRAFIDSEHVDGELNFAHAILPGESEREVMISSYVCHPSMAINELSGPITAAFLYRKLAGMERRRFTYRFVFVPETIGSICYLHRFGTQLKQNLHAGLVLTCLGGERELSYKTSRRERAPIDEAVRHLMKQKEIPGSIRSFTPINGSDERQYCSPGFNLPVGQAARSVYNTYPEYHSSLDNKELMRIESLSKGVEEVFKILQTLELDGYYVNQSPYGEVKLDRHNLYPDMNSPLHTLLSANGQADSRVQLDRILTVLNYADGHHTLLEIANRCGCSALALEPILNVLRTKGLIVGPNLDPGNGWEIA